MFYWNWRPTMGYYEAIFQISKKILAKYSKKIWKSWFYYTYLEEFFFQDFCVGPRIEMV